VQLIQIFHVSSVLCHQTFQVTALPDGPAWN
jgi:hypothetical protein